MLCARMSRITCRISSSVSPRPTMMPLLGHVGVQRLELLEQVQAELVVGAGRASCTGAVRFQVVVHHIGGAALRISGRGHRGRGSRA